MLAAFTQSRPYHLQVFTFWLAIVPVVILLALVVGTLILQRRRTHRRRPRGRRLT